MSISFANALGIHEQALSFRTQRAEVLANNLVNADTPNFKARDIDFASVLAEQNQKAQGSTTANAGSFAMAHTNDRHIEVGTGSAGLGEEGLLYRNPYQPSLDQNSVDAQVEQAKYAENAVQFQASFTLLNSKFKGLLGAIRGE